MLPEHCLPRLAALLTGQGTVSEFVFPHQDRVLEIFASFVSGFNAAQFHESIPWKLLINMPPVLVRSEMIQSAVLKAGVNTLIGRSSVSRETPDASTLTGIPFLIFITTFNIKI